ncbi:hypothetical protein DPEC_G00208920 [Dallia pectoralis]|uniref:Uncharacterized protein n=1 Tax=Dallia pectoralis TaxID=75939 RepID=A0ACC2G5E1_DALPE|nr:hypothetical protein DPEC_G00208920 [Dallia pectoralis]
MYFKEFTLAGWDINRLWGLRSGHWEKTGPVHKEPNPEEVAQAVHVKDSPHPLVHTVPCRLLPTGLVEYPHFLHTRKLWEPDGRSEAEGTYQSFKFRHSLPDYNKVDAIHC